MLHVGRPAPNRPIGAFCIAGKHGELVFDLIFRFALSSLMKCGPNKAVLGLVRHIFDSERLWFMF